VGRGVSNVRQTATPRHCVSPGAQTTAYFTVPCSSSDTKSRATFSCSINVPPFMEPERLLQCPQEMVTGPYAESDELSAHPCPYFQKILFNIIIPYTPTSYQWSFAPFFQPQFCLHFSFHMHVKYPKSLIFLDLISLIVIGYLL
jgi:hypothetical protein